MKPSSVISRPRARGKDSVQWQLLLEESVQLRTRRILSIGHTRVGPGYKVLRKKPSFSNIHLTVSGKGLSLIKGRWQTVREGMAILAPEGATHGARALPRQSWEFCWICFDEPKEADRKISVSEPTLVRIDPQPISWAIKSLQQEFQGLQQKAVLDCLLQLIDLYAARILLPQRSENRLWRLWEEVAETPSALWTVEKMAAFVKLGERQLLRLCKKESGRSLQEQLIHIRLTRATSFLQIHDLKLQAVAESVGYQDSYTFSKAFKKWSGVSPSDYRLKTSHPVENGNRSHVR